jgi:hypothetical protein
MKNLTLAAVSVFAMTVAFEANAANPNVAQPMPTNPAPMAKPMAVQPAPMTKPMAKSMAKPMPAQPMAAVQGVEKPCPIHHAKKHHARKHHVKHHKAHKYHAQSRPVHVAFPPAQGCVVQDYCGTASCPYVNHGGYYWYPQTQATMISGYSPSYWNGNYWYASHHHPHVVYVDGQAVKYVQPYTMDTAYHMYHNHMVSSYKYAPTVKPTAVYQ